MTNIFRLLFLFATCTSLLIITSCKNNQAQDLQPAQSNEASKHDSPTIPALIPVLPTDTPQPSPVPTKTLEADNLITTATIEQSTISPSTGIEPQETRESTYEYDEIFVEEVPEESHNLTAAEVANSGTNLYKTECVSAQGEVEGCLCQIEESEILSIDFENSEIKFSEQTEPYNPLTKISENVYQWNGVQGMFDFIDMFSFSLNGFEREITFFEQSNSCTINILYSLNFPPEPIILTKYGFGQNGRLLGIGFIIENPNPDLAFVDAHYSLTVYDESNNEVGSEDRSIDYILPQQLLGIGSTIILEEGVSAAKIDIQLSHGRTKTADPQPLLIAESKALYFGDASFYIATGMLHNLSNAPVYDQRISAIAYDEFGNIVGGGESRFNFINGNSSRGIEVDVASDEEIAYVELIPIQTDFNASQDDSPLGSNIRIVDFGFSQNENIASYGFLIENPDEKLAIASSLYYVVAYSEDGSVVLTDEGFINLILPNQTLGIGADLQPIFNNMNIDYIEVALKEGKYFEAEILSELSFEDVSFENQHVRGTIVNPYPTEEIDAFENFRVYGIAYNELGEIIGGGDDTYLIGDNPTIEKFTVEVWVPTESVPYTVDMYASPYLYSINR